MMGTSGVVLAHVAAGLIFLAVRMGWVPVSLWTGVPMTVAIVLLVAFYAIGPGVCVWLVLSELMPGRIRANGMSIALFFNRGVAMAIDPRSRSMRRAPSFGDASGMAMLCDLSPAST